MFKHGPGDGQGVNTGPVLFAKARVEDFPYNIKISVHGTP
jgi:hypothetical protein